MKLYHALFLNALLLSVPLHAADAVPTAQAESAAQSRYAKGREHFLAERYSEALAEFRAASDLFESPNSRLYIARCEKALQNNARAIIAYERAAHEAADRTATDPRYAATRDAALKEMKEIESSVGRLVVKASGLPRGTHVLVGGEPLPEGAWGVATPLDPGHVAIRATASGFRPEKRDVSIVAGETVEVEFSLKPLPQEPQQIEAQDNEPPRTERRGGGVRTAGFVISAIGLAGGGAGFAVFGLRAKNRFGDLQNECQGACGSAQQSQIDQGKRDQLIANLSLAGGAALFTLGAVMIAVGGPKTVLVETKGGMRVVPTVAQNGRATFVGVSGEF